MTVSCLWLVLCQVFALPPLALVEHGARVLAAPFFALVYQSDRDQVKAITAAYRVGQPVQGGPKSWQDTWRALERSIPGFQLYSIPADETAPSDIPFVYERPDEGYLRVFRERYNLREVVAAGRTEYEAMLLLGGWVGTRWDHGTDRGPGDSQVCDPAAVVEAGARGAKFWCEIAARTLTHAATSLGWPARVITASSDGYTWEHAVAELWSNEFGKWFVIDADFNIVYERNGVPLSAFELSHEGPQLARSGELVVRPIAPPKRSLPLRDVLAFYSYVHIDMRNDWCSRPLRRGSPAGGDLATWWTARKGFHPVLTARPRVDNSGRFNWKVNAVNLRVLDARRSEDGLVDLTLGLEGYSPTHRTFEISVDGEDWRRLSGPSEVLRLANGDHRVRARLAGDGVTPGPPVEVAFALGAAPDNRSFGKRSYARGVAR